jgi:flavodoxin I
MAKIGLFYGSSSGNTLKVADLIKTELVNVDLHDVNGSSPIALKDYDVLILGTSTWNHGELQSHWDAFFWELDKVDFAKKTVAFFGLGDSVRFPENFVDGMAYLHDKIVEKGGKVIGYWPMAGYDFQESKAVRDGKFVGLAVDQDSEPQLTKKRVHEWCKQLKEEMVG